MKNITISIPPDIAKALSMVMKGREYPDEITEIYIIDEVGMDGILRAEELYKQIVKDLEDKAKEYEETEKAL